jgi:hypothetical protein
MKLFFSAAETASAWDSASLPVLLPPPTLRKKGRIWEKKFVTFAGKADPTTKKRFASTF